MNISALNKSRHRKNGETLYADPSNIYDSVIVCLRITWLKKRDEYLLRTVNVMRTPIFTWNRPFVRWFFGNFHSDTLTLLRPIRKGDREWRKQSAFAFTSRYIATESKKENLDSSFSDVVAVVFVQTLSTTHRHTREIPLNIMRVLSISMPLTAFSNRFIFPAFVTMFFFVYNIRW